VRRPGPSRRRSAARCAWTSRESSSSLERHLLARRNERNRFKATVAEFKTGRIASGVPGNFRFRRESKRRSPRPTFRSSFPVITASTWRRVVRALELDLKIRTAHRAPRSSISLQGTRIRFLAAGDPLQSLGRPARSRPYPAPAGEIRYDLCAPSAGRRGTVDLSPLKGLNLKGGLKIDRMIASNVKMEKVNLGVRPRAAGSSSSRFPQASIREPHRQRERQRNTNRFSMTAKLGGVAIGPLLRDALNKQSSGGPGDMSRSTYRRAAQA